MEEHVFQQKSIYSAAPSCDTSYDCIEIGLHGQITFLKCLNKIDMFISLRVW